MFRAMLVPSLGVTAVLAALWAAAIALAGAASPSAHALDPAIAGSVSAAWGVLQLAAIPLLGLVAGAPWTMLLGPAPLLLGEVAGLHLLLAEALGRPGVWTKGVLAALLGSLALAPLLRALRSRSTKGTIFACLALGAAALALDAAQVGLAGRDAALLASLEEWCELAMESVLAAAYLAALERSHVVGRLIDQCAGPDRRGHAAPDRAVGVHPGAEAQPRRRALWLEDDGRAARRTPHEDPMTLSNGIRQFHRWTSIVFTLTVIANFVVIGLGGGEPPAWITYAPLLPLFLLLFTGLYLFALPYLSKARRAG